MASVSVEVVLSICGAVFIVFKVVDYIIKRRNDSVLLEKFDALIALLNDKFSRSYDMAAGTQTVVHKLWDMHNKVDDNGAPLWYMPRSWYASQEKIVNAMQQIANTQNNIAKTLDRMEQRQDRLEQRGPDETHA